jgi:hypothetical protein
MAEPITSGILNPRSPVRRVTISASNLVPAPASVDDRDLRPVTTISSPLVSGAPLSFAAGLPNCAMALAAAA